MAEAKPKSSTKKAVAKTPVEAEAPKTKAAGTKRVTKPKKPAAASAMGAEERYKMTEVAAYYIAQRNGFVGDPKLYWAEAEQQIAQMLPKSD